MPCSARLACLHAVIMTKEDSGDIQMAALFALKAQMKASIGTEEIGWSFCSGGLMSHSQLDSTAVRYSQ